ncbi:MAG: DMT family transporter [Alphaproteobacteria bacterium]|nr:DMT family transporter [Alphaproteobacteria bacterium]
MPASRTALDRLSHPYAILMLSMLVGSGTLVAGRGSVGDIPPIAFAFGRWTVAVVVLLPLGIRPLLRQRYILMRHWPLLLGMGATACAAHHAFLFLGLQTTTALNASLELAGMPIVTVALVFLLSRDRVRWPTLVGMVVGLLGVVVIVCRGDFSVLSAFDFHRGDGFVLLAVLAWGLYSVLLGRMPPGTNPVGLLLAIATIGFILLIPPFLWELSLGQRTVFSPTSVLAIVYVGIFPSVIGYALWQHGVAQVGPATASQFTYFGPLFSGAWALVLLGEPLEFYHAGALLILVGIYLATRPAASISRRHEHAPR